MTEELINDILNQLKNREISEYHVKKEDFLLFRSVLVKREDFKHFRGVAHHGGSVQYEYLDTARS